MSNNAPVKKRRTSGHSPSLTFERDELSDESSDRGASEGGDAEVAECGDIESDLNTDDEVDFDISANARHADKEAGSSALALGDSGPSCNDRVPAVAPRRLTTQVDVFEQNVLETSSEDDDDAEDDEYSGTFAVQGDDGDDGDYGDDDDVAECTASGPQPDAMDGGAAYQQFLRAILADDDAPTTANFPAASLLDDEEGDIDFDYLTAAAEIVEDPLEFRNDRTVHVTRREIVSLVAGNPERRRRRPRAPSHFPFSGPALLPGAIPFHPAPIAGAIEPGSLFPSTGDFNRNVLSPTPGGTGSSVLEGQLPSVQPIAMLQPKSIILTDAQFWAQNVCVLQQQLNSHVLLLASVRSKAREASVKESSERLLRELIAYRDTSRHFKSVFDPIRQRFENPLYPSCESETYFATPSLAVVEGFLAEASLGREDVNGFMASLQPFADQTIAAALIHGGKRLPCSEEEIPWTMEDDALLALLIGKYSMDFGNNARLLLPYRSVASCEQRMRFLASRRCRDNPVKAMVLEVTSNVRALSAMEIGIISEAIARFEPDHSPEDLDWGGPGTQVWQRIQQEFLPHRDWRQMEKLWSWRQSRRKYKRNERRKRKVQEAARSGTNL